MTEQCFCLRWNNFQSNVVGDLKTLLEQEEFVDVTLACEGKSLKAHRLMLSACSNYFRNLLKENPSEHPIIFLRDVQFWELESIMDFIYNGQVNVMQDQLPGFIRTAEALQIKGLAAVNNNNNNNNSLQTPKMYEFKQIQDMLMRQPDNVKDNFTSRLRPPLAPTSSSLLSHEALKHSIIPPLIQPPHKRFRTENPSPLSPHHLVASPKHSPNSLLNRTYPFVKDLSPPTIDSNGCQDLSKKEKNLDDHKSSPAKKSPKNATDDVSDGVDNISERLSPPTGETKPNVKSQENGTSRSGSPEEERQETEEDRSSHDGSIASLDGYKDEWSYSDQSSPMSISVNEAGLPICRQCGKVFKHQGSLVAHYQVHQQRTKCPVCKKVLSRHYHMKVHLLTVHKVPDAEIEGLLRSQNIA